MRGKPAGQGRGGTFEAAWRHGKLSLLEQREHGGGAASDLTIPRPTGPALRLANSGALLQPGQGPRPWAASRCSVLLRAAPFPLPWGMSLLTNYEGLRHQIEKLVRENEELKKLVRLIRENYELKSAIKTQAGGLGISGFSSGLSEAAASASPHQGNCKRLSSRKAGREG